MDHLRKEYRRVKGDQPMPGNTGHTAILERVPDPGGAELDRIWDEEWKRGLFEAALQRVKRRVEPRHFQIFDCYVRKEWPVKDVAQNFRVSAGQVYLIKNRLSALIASEVKRLEAAQVGEASSESGGKGGTRVPDHP